MKQKCKEKRFQRTSLSLGSVGYFSFLPFLFDRHIVQYEHALTIYWIAVGNKSEYEPTLSIFNWIAVGEKKVVCKVK